MINFETYKGMDSKCVKLAKLTHNAIDPAIRRNIFNALVYRLYDAQDSLDSPFWNRTITLTVADDLEELADTVTNGGIITAINSTAKTISRSTGTFPAGAIVDVVIANKTTGAKVAQLKGRISVAGATGTYVKIGTGTEATFASATHVCFVNVMKRLSATSATISDQYVKKVLKVFDDQGTGNKERVFDWITDPREFGNLWDSAFRASDVCVYQEGETIQFFVGSGATALGVVQAEIVAKPTLYTEATAANKIDLPPELNQQLTDELVAEYLRQAGQPIPDDVNKRLAEYQTRYGAKESEKQKEKENERHRSL